MKRIFFLSIGILFSSACRTNSVSSNSSGSNGSDIARQFSYNWPKPSQKKEFETCNSEFNTVPSGQVKDAEGACLAWMLHKSDNWPDVKRKVVVSDLKYVQDLLGTVSEKFTCQDTPGGILMLQQIGADVGDDGPTIPAAAFTGEYAGWQRLEKTQTNDLLIFEFSLMPDVIEFHKKRRQLEIDSPNPFLKWREVVKGVRWFLRFDPTSMKLKSFGELNTSTKAELWRCE